MSDTLPSGQLSNIPWRRTGVKYTNNEAYFDVVEEVDAIIDKTGVAVFSEIQGFLRYRKWFFFFFNLNFLNVLNFSFFFFYLDWLLYKT